MEQVTERIFDALEEEPLPSGQLYGDYESRLHALIVDAESHEEDFLRNKREENIKYYVGDEPALDEDEGRSTFVSTDVRDTIMTILPSLVRMFMATNDIVYFVPTSHNGEGMARQAMDYVNHVFYNENEGFLTLYGAFKDALTVKGGVIKWRTENQYEAKTAEYSNITIDQARLLVQEASELGEHHIEAMDMGSNGIVSRFVIQHLTSKPMVKITGVPPEEFRVSKTAKTIRTASLVGHQRQESVSELVKMGFDEETLLSYTSRSNVFSEERYLRNEALTDESYTDDGIPFGEYYVRIDKDGDGIDELRYICTIGDNYEIVVDEPADYTRFAWFGCEPVPHTLIGDSITDLVKDIQRMKTNMMRGVLDNLAEVIRPRTYVNQTLVNLDDALNPEQSAVVRVNGDPNSAVYEKKSVFVGEEVLAVVDKMDAVRASRTGITEASKGLDPKAMQSTTLVGVDAIVSGAQERIELIATILAHTGWKDLVQGILKEIVNNPNKISTIKLRGKWENVNPSLYDPSYRVEVNPTFGKGTDISRLMALREVKATQELIIGKFGVKNPVVSPQEYRNTIVDILEMVNIKDASRYFRELTPDVINNIMNAPEEPSPEMLLAKSNYEKVKMDAAKNIAANDITTERMERDDAFRRDKLQVETVLEIAQMNMDERLAKSEQEAKAITGEGSRND